MRVAAATFALTAAAHVAWWLWLTPGGGDLAAQLMWTGAVEHSPNSAYDLAAFGGLHVAGYSLLSPYLLAWLGVRLVTAVASSVTAALVAWIASRFSPHAWLVALATALPIVGNSVSGRTTFAVGSLFAVGAVAVLVAWPAKPGRGAVVARAAALATMALLATVASPVSGLFVGFLAGALFVTDRRGDALALGVPPLAVVLVATALFPLQGVQPMRFVDVVLPISLGIATFVVAPSEWQVLRWTGLVNALAAMVVFAVPSPVGANVMRLTVLFGGIALVVVATHRATRTSRRRAVAGAGAIAALAVAVGIPIYDVYKMQVDPAWKRGLPALLEELDERGAVRVNAVMPLSHYDAPALAPHVWLARGWNRQADRIRHQLFYEGGFDAEAYAAWLRRWGVSHVVLAEGAVEPTSEAEVELIEAGVEVLEPVWSGAGWRVFAVADPEPIVEGAELVAFDRSSLTIHVSEPGDVRLRVIHSPWLAVAPDGACIAPDVAPDTGSGNGDDAWTIVRVERPGRYTIDSPYRWSRGTPCAASGS